VLVEFVTLTTVRSLRLLRHDRYGAERGPDKARAVEVRSSATSEQRKAPPSRASHLASMDL
jgi:hypothetical protein